MNVVYSEDEMKKFLEEATRVSQVVFDLLMVMLRLHLFPPHYSDTYGNEKNAFNYI